MTLLADVVTASRDLTHTSSRSQKVAILAELLRRADASGLAAAVGFLAGVPRQPSRHRLLDDLRLRARAGRGGVTHDRAIGGAAGGLEIFHSMRGEPGSLEHKLDWRHTFGEGSALEQLLACRVLRAALEARTCGCSSPAPASRSGSWLRWRGTTARTFAT